MNEPLRWGLLSTARINNDLIPAIRASEEHKLLAVASRDLQRAQKYAAEWKIPQAYGSYEALLADPNIDAVYIPLPNHLHAPYSILAAQAGKHILCEKPFALQLADVDAMIAAAHKNNVTLLEAFVYRYHPQTWKVQEMLAAGELGALHTLNGTFTFKLDREVDIRWDAQMGGGSLWDVGCYPVSYILMTMGQSPVEVFSWQKKAEGGTDLTFSGQLRFSSGAVGQFSCSFGLPFHTFMEIRGEKATIKLDNPFPAQLKTEILLEQDGKSSRLNFKPEFRYAGIIQALKSAVEQGTPPKMSLDQSRQIIATLLALLESARTGKPVLL